MDLHQLRHYIPLLQSTSNTCDTTPNTESEVHDLQHLNGVTIDSNGRARAKMARNANGGNANKTN